MCVCVVCTRNGNVIGSEWAVCGSGKTFGGIVSVFLNSWYSCVVVASCIFNGLCPAVVMAMFTYITWTILQRTYTSTQTQLHLGAHIFAPRPLVLIRSLSRSVIDEMACRPH